MGRRFQQDESDGETKVDMSPLIDCVFILLIFFIVTTTFVDEKGKAMPTPDSAAPPPPEETDEEPSNVVIEITAQGDVMSKGQVVGLNGVQTLIKQSRDGRESPVIIQAVGDARVGLLMRVKEEAERAGSEAITVTHRHGGN